MSALHKLFVVFNASAKASEPLAAWVAKYKLQLLGQQPYVISSTVERRAYTSDVLGSTPRLRTKHTLRF